MDLTSEEIARLSADAMQADDAASAWLGIERVHVAPGEAVMQLKLEPRHMNGHGICHGGFIFTLADTAFAFACNSYNRTTVAQHNNITFIRPGQAGRTLVATAREVSVSGRSGIYDVRVEDDTGDLIAEMRGLSRTIGGHNFEEPAADTPDRSQQ